MAIRSKGRNNGVTLYKRTMITSARQAGRGINRGGVKKTVNFPGLGKSRGFGSINNAVKVRRGRR